MSTSIIARCNRHIYCKNNQNLYSHVNITNITQISLKFWTVTITTGVKEGNNTVKVSITYQFLKQIQYRRCMHNHDKL